MLDLASLISACVFGFLFVYFGLIVDLCLVVWLGRAVSCLPRESEASRTPETLDSPTVEGHQKMTLNKFKIIEITIFKNNFFSRFKTQPNAGSSQYSVRYTIYGLDFYGY